MLLQPSKMVWGQMLLMSVSPEKPTVNIYCNQRTALIVHHVSTPRRYAAKRGIDVWFILIFMRYNNGEGTNNRDDAKYGKNHDNITEDTRKPTVKREVPKSELPAGLRSRTIYGEKK